MSELRAAVYITPPLPLESQIGEVGGHWSPISSTLVYSATEAVLVDTPITIAQTEKLLEWIERIAPGRKLSYIYITHGHGDHFFGTPVLQKRFPEVRVVATAGTVAHMHQQVEETTFQQLWGARFGNEIQQPFLLAEPLPESNEFNLQDKWKFQAINVGHTDTYDSTFLWVPDLRLAVAGDVVYGQVHQMFLEANTKAKRQQWIEAIKKLETYNPAIVVPGHCQEGEILGSWHLGNTKQYIKDFDSVIDDGARTVKEIVAAVTKLYPDRFNTGALFLSAMGTVNAAETATKT